MSQLHEEPVGGKLLNSIIDYACKTKPEIFSSSADCLYLNKVFSDDALVSSCLSLFENDLNISLAAEKLYMHRNTLIYRIKKIEKLIGLNVTKFSDAVTFVALLNAYKKGGSLGNNEL